MVEPAPGGGWGTGKLNILLLALLLSGCARGDAAYSPSSDYGGYFVDSHVHVPMAAEFSAGWPGSAAASSSYRTTAQALAQDGGDRCSFAGRFDSHSALAYNFDDNRSQIGFNMSVNDHGAGLVNVSRAAVVFRYKFDQVKSPPRAEKCRYASHWQGLVGSSYNELFLRDHNTLWGEVRDRGLDFWNK
jgi:hypothetical protein